MMSDSASLFHATVCGYSIVGLKQTWHKGPGQAICMQITLHRSLARLYTMNSSDVSYCILC